MDEYYEPTHGVLTVFRLGGCRAIASVRQRRQLPPLIWRYESTLANLIPAMTVSTAQFGRLPYCERYICWQCYHLHSSRSIQLSACCRCQLLEACILRISRYQPCPTPRQPARTHHHHLFLLYISYLATALGWHL